MFKKSKITLIISSIIILLPILFGIIVWDKLPDVMATRWSADGNANNYASKVFAVFILPCIILVLHFLCLLFTFLDKRQKEQSPKALGMLFWIMPIISVFTSGIMYSAAFGNQITLQFFVPVFLGILLIIIGNYLPKTKQNRTLGIKIKWTLNNEENWNKTHRFSGKIWVIGGLIMLFSAFLPFTTRLYVLPLVIIAITVIPTVYSYNIYKRHKTEGVKYTTVEKSKAEKIALRISAVLVPIILVGTAILMFTGDINLSYTDSAFTIEATYWNDLEVEYSKIDNVEHRSELKVGMRTYGFSSARLSMGTFQNDEFGSYTLYAYSNAKEFIVIRSGENVLVIGMKEKKDTQAIYDTILSKTTD